VIADNKIAEGAGWDFALLAIELGELIELLPAEGMDVSLTGFEPADIDLLLADRSPGPGPEDAVPPLAGKGGNSARRPVVAWKALAAVWRARPVRP
jgi:hypothetical protein